ncbi:MAG TPA: hypothetical protein VFQ20_08155 [Burkholderiaceae bacterium]|nr:hypothetical protein [Burkholderiaceae bacterium]
MDNLPGKLLAVYVLATLLAAGVGAGLVLRYRSALPALMRAPFAPSRPDGAATTVGVARATAALPSWLPHPLPTLADWRRAEWRLVAGLVGLSVLIALTHGAITHWATVDSGWSWPRMLLLSALLAWPALPAIALLRRWRQRRLVAALVAWYAAAWVLAMLRSNEAQSGALVAQWLAFAMGPPVLALLLLTTRATRAAAPWLWLPLALLCFAAILGLDLLAWIVRDHLAAFAPVLQWLSPTWAVLLFALAFVALAWWPVARFARWLAHAYAKRWVSDAAVLFTAAWALNLGFDALATGPWALVPLLWIPLALGLARRWPRDRDGTRTPTLLVLRVFRHDANINALFEEVVERWRAVGQTVLIAGTDLVGQTTDAADLFDFLDGRLAKRFVHDAADVPARLAGFEWQPDAEGRWRVNECYCHDDAWQVALAALVQRADLVLMDLRGFQAYNAGCRFELGVLARAAHLARAVVIGDEGTDFAVARADAADAPEGRFVWIDLGAPGEQRVARARLSQRVRAALAGAGSPQPAAGTAALVS